VLAKLFERTEHRTGFGDGFIDRITQRLPKVHATSHGLSPAEQSTT
jgi:5-formyltetrahydrofolate cyclo-ligase